MFPWWWALDQTPERLNFAIHSTGCAVNSPTFGSFSQGSTGWTMPRKKNPKIITLPFCAMKRDQLCHILQVQIPWQMKVLCFSASRLFSECFHSHISRAAPGGGRRKPSLPSHRGKPWQNPLKTSPSSKLASVLLAPSPFYTHQMICAERSAYGLFAGRDPANPGL